MSLVASAGRIESHDIEEFNQIASPWQVQMRQMSAGHFRSETEFLNINNIMLYRERANKESMITGGAPDGLFMIGGTLTPSNHIDWCGTTPSTQCLAFAAPNAEVDFILPDGSYHWVLLIPEHLFLTHLDKEIPITGQIQSFRHLQVRHELGRMLPNLVNSLIDKYLVRSDLLTNEQECQILISQLTETIRKIVQNLLTDNDICGTRHVRRLAVRNAVNYLIEHSEALVTIPALARASGASQRTLEMAFRENLDMTPLAYLVRDRLNNVHQALSKVEPGAINVTEVGLKYGFSDLGRFATKYKQLFGELPSTTLSHKPVKNRICFLDTFASSKLIQ